MKHPVVNLFMLLLAAYLMISTGPSANALQNSGYGMVEIACNNSATNAKLQSGDYRIKTDNFLILQDTSRSMAMRLLESPTVDVKLEYSKGLLNCLNETLPDSFHVKAGLRNFASMPIEEGLIYGMAAYSKAGFADAVGTITETAGKTSIGTAINFGGRDIENLYGQTAVILFSDGMNTELDDPVEAATTLKDRYGNSVCIYTVQINVDIKGKKTLQQMAEASNCGFAVNGNAIDDAAGMDKFVTEIFLQKVREKIVAPVLDTDPDSDGDGVPDSRDKCPNTPEGIIVDSDGCPIPIKEKISITLHIEFDFDKAEVKSRYHYDIAKIANILKAYPDKDLELEGHTDSKGTDAYNIKLSKRRAESVKKYLIEKFGIEESRISAVGYGESMPIATNDTEEGRQNNRRVVANIETVIDI
jgi:OOP family OmpA-OmpF porin